MNPAKRHEIFNRLRAANPHPTTELEYSTPFELPACATLADAVARQLASVNRSYTLFATHYFELTALAEPGSGIANLHLDAVEHGDTLVFMHAVRPGPANRSFGLQVAALAGVPKPALQQARARLAELSLPATAPTSIARQWTT